MELFTAGDTSQMQTIKKWIDESDVYMLILGGRYGSIESTTNISYTELEYGYAVQEGKSLFAVVITEQYLEQKVKAFGTTCIERDAANELSLFRKKVLSNISAFYSDIKDIKLCVHECMADLVDNPELVGWVSASAFSDSQSLQEEIRRLNHENEELKKSLNSQTLPLLSNKNDDDFSEIKKILGNIQIKVPANATTDGKEFEQSLLAIVSGNYPNLVSGVTNSAGGSDAEAFLFLNVAPKLQPHGLVKFTPVPGTQYRIATSTPKGDRFFAHMEKKQYEARTVAKQKSSSSPSEKPSEKPVD